MLNLEKGRYVYGGSTISQQLVKNLFLTRQKTLSRKLEEAFIVWRMEEVLTKDRILELYLNCIEFGPDIYGIGRAAHYYFGKKPSELTVLEGTFIAALKPAPWQGGWFKKAGRSPDTGFWYDRMSKIMRRMHDHGHLSADELQAAEPYSVAFHGSEL
jgi:membrane peptidoglycan carboxypeptidase